MGSLRLEGHHGWDDSDSIQREMDKIYESYTGEESSSLDTAESGVGGRVDGVDGGGRVVRVKRLIAKHNRLPDVHISSHLSSISLDNGEMAKSAPPTPNSGSSFDFSPREPHAMTNSSLNVLLDTPTGDANGLSLVSSAQTKSSSLSEENEDELSLPIVVDIGDETPKVAAAAASAAAADDIDVDNVDEEETEWHDKGAAVKKIAHEKSGYRIIKRGVQDFEFGRNLGEGSYSTVILATDKRTSKQYAVKVLDKRHIIKEKKVKYVNIEKHALNRLSNRPGIISLYFTFQDKASLYFVLDFALNGELLTLIKKYNTLNEDCVRHFGAQILDAIKYMHDNGVIHRDIKPENILLDDKLRIQITDFGTARLLEKKDDESEEYPLDVKAKSFVGTAEYVSPELLENKYCGKPGDIWAYGCIVYQMIAGKPPFKAPNEYLTFQKITKLQYAFSAGFPLVLRDLIKKLLVLQPSKRYTIPQIQDHYFFQSVDWNDMDSIWNKPPPELSPYKMTAKSMMKVPQLNKSNSQPVISTRTASKRQVSSSGSNDVEARRIASETVGKNVDPATVAAFVLNKKEGSAEGGVSPNETEEPPNSSSSLSAQKSSSDNGASHRRASVPDYIPGTNILRPYVRQQTLRGQAAQRLSTPKKPKADVIEVTPMNALDVAWASYFSDDDERILKIGQLIVFKESTESFEKRYRGLLHDSPLGFEHKFQSRRKNETSFLAQVVHGGNKSLRGVVADLEDVLKDEGYNENKAIATYHELDEVLKPASVPPLSSDSRSSSVLNKESKSTKFKKFLRSHMDKGPIRNGSSEDNEDSQSEATESQDSAYTLEKLKTCTVIVTTFGRVLILYRNDYASEFTLVNEIQLNHSFIQIKQVAINANTKKRIAGQGILAIMSTTTTFVFEVENHELFSWATAFAKSKYNQSERQILADQEKLSRSRTGGSNASGLSPKIASSPKLPPTSLKASPELPPPSTAAKTTSATPRNQEKPALNHKSSRIKEPSSKSAFQTKLPKRKPPPDNPSHSSPTTQNIVEEDVTLHAAQLAVSNNAGHTLTYNRRSSFTKKDESTSSSSKPGIGSHVTSMNSKLLARSNRKK